MEVNMSKKKIEAGKILGKVMAVLLVAMMLVGIAGTVIYYIMGI